MVERALLQGRELADEEVHIVGLLELVHAWLERGRDALGDVTQRVVGIVREYR